MHHTQAAHHVRFGRRHSLLQSRLNQKAARWCRDWASEMDATTAATRCSIRSESQLPCVVVFVLSPYGLPCPPGFLLLTQAPKPCSSGRVSPGSELRPLGSTKACEYRASTVDPWLPQTPPNYFQDGPSMTFGTLQQRADGRNRHHALLCYAHGQSTRYQPSMSLLAFKGARIYQG